MSGLARFGLSLWDRRKSRRHRLFEPAALFDHKGERRAHVLDLSTTGLLLHAKKPLKPGQRVALTFAKLGVVGQVVWAEASIAGSRWSSRSKRSRSRRSSPTRPPPRPPDHPRESSIRAGTNPIVIPAEAGIPCLSLQTPSPLERDTAAACAGVTVARIASRTPGLHEAPAPRRATVVIEPARRELGDA